MTLLATLALVAGCAVVAGLAAWSGVAAAGRDVLAAAWIVPAMVMVHMVQLWLSGLGWRELLGRASLSALGALRLRWIREGVNSLLPVAQVGGPLVGVRLLVRRGVSPARAGAATTLDLTAEAAMLPVFVLFGLGALWATGADRAALPWGLAAVAALAGIALAFALAQRAGLLGWLELGLRRIAPVSLRADGLQDELVRLARDRRRLARAAGLHLASWCLGAAETWLGLAALGHRVGLLDAFVIESLGVAARSAGFAVPGAIGVQEGGFVLAAGLFGIPPGPALALSALKRLREVAVGLPGLAMWQWAEGRRAFGRG